MKRILLFACSVFFSLSVHTVPAAEAMRRHSRIIRLVMETYNIAASQLPAIDREFAAAYRSFESARSDAIEKIPQADRSKCKSADNFSNPSCSCANGLAGKSFNQKLIAQEKYDAQKIALYQSYIVKIKGLVQQVDQNIAKLHYGADIKSKKYQKMLFSSQSAAPLGSAGKVYIRIDKHDKCDKILFCDSKTGTFLNEASHKPDPIYGDAEKGDCIHQFQVKDW